MSKMKQIKHIGIIYFVALIFSCTGCSPKNYFIGSPTITSSNTYTPKPTLTITPSFTPTLTLTPSITPTISKTRISLSAELYLDENSSRDRLQGEPYHQDYHNFSNGNGNGFVYHFQNEEWIADLAWTRTLPFDDDPMPNEGELRQHYIQLWRDGKLLYFFPVNGGGQNPKRFLRYKDHWFFLFMDDWVGPGRIVQDGILLNDLHNYDSAFSLFLLDNKPFFFFRRGKQLGLSFNNQEIRLSYANIIYGPVCCDGGGNLNPRGTDKMVGFFIPIGKDGYKYIEIGLK